MAAPEEQSLRSCVDGRALLRPSRPAKQSAKGRLAGQSARKDDTFAGSHLRCHRVKKKNGIMMTSVRSKNQELMGTNEGRIPPWSQVLKRFPRRHAGSSSATGQRLVRCHSARRQKVKDESHQMWRLLNKRHRSHIKTRSDKHRGSVRPLDTH